MVRVRVWLFNALAGVAGSAQAPGWAPAGAGEPRVLGATRAGHAPGGPSNGLSSVVSKVSPAHSGPYRRTPPRRWDRADDGTQRDTPHSGCVHSTSMRRGWMAGVTKDPRDVGFRHVDGGGGPGLRSPR